MIRAIALISLAAMVQALPGAIAKSALIAQADTVPENLGTGKEMGDSIQAKVEKMEEMLGEQSKMLGEQSKEIALLKRANAVHLSNGNSISKPESMTQMVTDGKSKKANLLSAYLSAGYAGGVAGKCLKEWKGAYSEEQYAHHYDYDNYDDEGQQNLRQQYDDFIKCLVQYMQQQIGLKLQDDV